MRKVWDWSIIAVSDRDVNPDKESGHAENAHTIVFLFLFRLRLMVLRRLRRLFWQSFLRLLSGHNDSDKCGDQWGEQIQQPMPNRHIRLLKRVDPSVFGNSV